MPGVFQHFAALLLATVAFLGTVLHVLVVCMLFAHFGTTGTRFGARRADQVRKRAAA
jgi:hypothetical protein